MNEATRRANWAIEARGYLVIAYRPWRDRMPSVGKTLLSADNGEISGPLRVVKKTTQSDFIEQAYLWGCSDRIMNETLESSVEYFRLVAE